MLCDKWAQELVFPDLANGLLVALNSPWSWVELRPVDLIVMLALIIGPT